jgi:hypothetical protein
MPSQPRPTSLPARIYLLACDTERHKLAARELPLLVRGAALADLNLRGCLVDDGRSVRASGTLRTGDGVLDDVLRDVSEHGPHGWRYWLRRNARQTLRDVQQQLVAAGSVSVQRGRVFLFATTRITVLDPDHVRALRESVRDAVRGNGSVPAEHATLVALVAVGELGTVLSRKDRKTHSARIRELTEQGSTAVPALRKVLRQIKAARAAANGG